MATTSTPAASPFCRHSVTVAARMPGYSMHGMLRAPRTATGESSGTLQYRSCGVSGTSSSVGERRSSGGRKPVMQGVGR
ncbi:hypothetical protein ACFSSF_03035 [Dietzia aerolata]|uniref:hypothetical protein n=1 Tax=Dietzia aerolata TaxID=595984 RepID=UPI00363AF2EF